MNGKIELVRMGSGAHFDKTPLDNDVIAVDFVDNNGKRFSVSFRDGMLEVHTADGKLAIYASAANTFLAQIGPI